MSDLPHLSPGHEVTAAGDWNPAMDAINAATHGLTGSAYLLHSDHGTSNNAAAEDMGTYAVSGLTVKDRLLVVLQLRSGSGDTDAPVLQNKTDGVTIMGLNGNSTLVTLFHDIEVHVIGVHGANSTAVACIGMRGTKDDDTQTGGAVAIKTSTFVTAWTSAWTLGFRHGGVHAPGTTFWSWSIYKLPGQVT